MLPGDNIKEIYSKSQISNQTMHRMMNWPTVVLEQVTVCAVQASPVPSATSAPSGSWTSPPAHRARAPLQAQEVASVTGSVSARSTQLVPAVTGVRPATLRCSRRTRRDVLSASATESPAPVTLQVLALRCSTMSQVGTLPTSAAECGCRLTGAASRVV